MLRRYQDAARCFNAVLSHLNRVKQYHQRSAQYDQARPPPPPPFLFSPRSARLSPRALRQPTSRPAFNPSRRSSLMLPKNPDLYRNPEKI